MALLHAYAHRGLCRRPNHEVRILAERHRHALAVHSEVENTTTSLPFLAACLTMTSVPPMLVSIVPRAVRTMRRTPTAAARWNTVSAASISRPSGDRS